VHAAGLDRGTWHLMTGRPYLLRLAAGPRRPRNAVLGRDLAGTVVAVGSAVSRFSVDIDAAAAQFEKAGGTLLSDPLDLPGGDAGPGNRFLYARTPWGSTPWGSTVELVTCPSAQAYEATTELRRWRPEP